MATCSLLMLVATTPSIADTSDKHCPILNGEDLIPFDGGSIGFSAGLKIDADGAQASYTPGDHGYSYIADGVDLIENGTVLSCRENFRLCREKWILAEADDFRPGSPQFCAFGIEITPWKPEGRVSICKNGRVVGNGKGRPKFGAPFPAIGGGSTRTYISTTALRQDVDGQVKYIDSAVVPGVVVPTGRGNLLGAVVWVSLGNRQAFAIVSDTGPSFGEGSIALYHLLTRGRIGIDQPLGPIPVSLRCGPEEKAIRAPFVSAPDVINDQCPKSGHPSSSADIRAKGGIEGGVVTIILSRVRPLMAQGVVLQDIGQESLAKLAEVNGYPIERLKGMAACLHRDDVDRMP